MWVSQDMKKRMELLAAWFLYIPGFFLSLRMRVRGNKTRDLIRGSSGRESSLPTRLCPSDCVHYVPKGLFCPLTFPKTLYCRRGCAIMHLDGLFTYENHYGPFLRYRCFGLASDFSHLHTENTHRARLGHGKITQSLQPRRKIERVVIALA